MRSPALPVAVLVALLPLLPLLPLATTSCGKLGGKGGDAGTDGAADGASPSTSLSFLGTFEGEIDAFTKDSAKPGAQPVPLAVLVKGGKVKLQIPEGLTKGPGSPLGEKGYIIFDSAAKKLTAVSDATKEAIVVDLNTSGKSLAGVAPPAAGPHGAAGSPSKITKTGKTDLVAGYTCENWDIAGDKKEGTVCMASDGPSWFSIPTTGIPPTQAWMLDLLDGKHFPLRYVGYGKDGATEETRIEVTKIDAKPVPDTEFQVPAGYKTIELEKMMGAMPGMPGMPIPHVPVPPPHH
jgi:hypothetical protein